MSDYNRVRVDLDEIGDNCWIWKIISKTTGDIVATSERPYSHPTEAARAIEAGIYLLRNRT